MDRSWLEHVAGCEASSLITTSLIRPPCLAFIILYRQTDMKICQAIIRAVTKCICEVNSPSVAEDLNEVEMNVARDPTNDVLDESVGIRTLTVANHPGEPGPTIET